MIRTSLLSLAAAAVTSVAALAQNCTDNQFRAWLVDANGVQAPTAVDPQTGDSFYQFTSEAVYLAFDPLLPSGTYYVHVTDPIGGADMVLSTNDPMDRFVTVTNTNGVITLSLPFGNAQNATFGLGLNGQGQSLLLEPFTTNPAEPCRFKAWYGDSWDLSNGPENPWLLRGGYDAQLGRCIVRSYSGFRIGSGNGTAVAGNVFRDTDRDGTRDAGEPGLVGWQVRLLGGAAPVTTTTDANGHYVFANVAAGTYTVDFTTASGFVTTTPQSFQIQVCGCADVAVGDFGATPELSHCGGHNCGHWTNCHQSPRDRDHCHRALPTLPCLHLRNQCGQEVAPGNETSFRWFLSCGNRWNMANQLSCELLSMHCNVLAGYVDGCSVIRDRQLGCITVAELLRRACASLAAHGYTPVGSPWRREQECLTNALENANNNRCWR